MAAHKHIYGEMILDFFILVLCLVSACLAIVVLSSLYPAAKELVISSLSVLG